MQSLTEIANRCGTDKGSLCHGYTIIYDMLLAPMRNASINLLEIGLLAGGPELDQSIGRSVSNIPSMRMWHEYLPNAHLYGLDISDFSAFENEWFKFFRADCGKRDELAGVAEAGIPFDIIVDDGSHASFHQQLTLEMLLPALKPGGLFIIEDLQWQPKTYEEELPRAPKTADLLYKLASSGPSRILSSDLTNQIASIVLYAEDDLVRLRKRFNENAGLSPTAPHFTDGSSTGTAAMRSRLRRVLEGFQAAADASLGAVRPTPRIKLAVIQKAWGRSA